jgi:uncharacterized protein
LIIRGARQVGKTWSVDAFGRQFDQFVNLNFEETPSLKQLFAGDLDVRRISRELCAIQGFSYKPDSLLLFFDEIQECPEAIKALRYFYEKTPEICVIAAGSLLEFSIDNLSFPVGRVSFYWMYPMTFKEFLAAKDLETLTTYIPALSSRQAVPEIIHTKLMQELHEYFLVGGMPEAVKTFITGQSYKEVGEVHQSIIYSYLEDLKKHYPRSDNDLFRLLLVSCGRGVGRQVKYAQLLPDERSEKIKKMLEKLFQCLILHPVHATNGEFPFALSADKKYLKLLFLDIGLMHHLCGVNYRDEFLNRDIMGLFKGALAEQFVGMELLAANSDSPPELYYWTRRKQGGDAEVDYLLERTEPIPLEVKSDKQGRLKSMHQALLEFPETPLGLVLSARNVEILEDQRLLFLPLYAAGNL